MNLLIDRQFDQVSICYIAVASKVCAINYRVLGPINPSDGPSKDMLPPGESPENWNRFYSAKKELWFLYNHVTGEHFWEAKKVGTEW